MQSVSSRIWTRVAVSISYDDKQYTTGTSKDRALIGTTNLSQSELGSNGNERVLYIPRNPKTTALLSDAV